MIDELVEMSDAQYEHMRRVLRKHFTPKFKEGDIVTCTGMRHNRTEVTLRYLVISYDQAKDWISLHAARRDNQRDMRMLGFSCYAGRTFSKEDAPSQPTLQPG